MRYNPLGRTGLFVSELCLGTMTFGGAGYFEYMGGLKQADADPLVKAAIDAGVNFIDTANVYSNGLSEEVTGQAIKNLGINRHEVVLATKAFGPMGDGPNQRGLSRTHLIEACQASLRRLGTDYIDLYQVHGFDAATPIEETLRALDVLVSHGHVRTIGALELGGLASGEGAGHFRAAEPCPLPDGSGLLLAGRAGAGARDRADAARRRAGAAGLEPAGRWIPQRQVQRRGRRGRQRKRPPRHARLPAGGRGAREPRGRGDAADLRQRMGARWRKSRWRGCCTSTGVTSVIMGAKRPDQLADNLGAAHLFLSADELKTLGEASALPAEYPGWMFEVQGQYRRGQLDQPPRGA